MKIKASKYNIFFDYEEHKIGFNSFTKEYVILDPTLFLMYDSSQKNADFSELQDIHPDFYNFLIEKGVLLDDSIDELAQVKKLVNQIDANNTRFELHINPTMNCNFKCWYCYETHIKDSKMDEQTKDKVISFTKSLLENDKNIKEFSLGWFGGEPMLYFDKVVHPLLKEINTICSENGIAFSSSMTSNGLLITQDVIDISQKYNLSFFQITLDGNRERHDKVRFISEGKGSYDKIVSNIKLIVKNKLRVLVRINCSSETLSGLSEIITDFEELAESDRPFITFDIHKVWQEQTTIDDEILSDMRWYYREKGFKVSTASYDTVENSCYGDHKNHAVINYNGDVFKCTARDFTNSNREGVLSDNGYITWNEKLEKRLNIKFKNKPCLECVIMPVCNGGCSQQAIEHEGTDYCVYDFDENKKRQLIIDRFVETLSGLESH